MALAVSLLVHLLALWALASVNPQTGPAATSEIALTLRLEAWKDASPRPSPAAAQPSQRERDRPTRAETIPKAAQEPSPRAHAKPRTHHDLHVSAGIEQAAPEPLPSTPVELSSAVTNNATQATRRSEEAMVAHALRWDLMQRIEQFKSYPRAARRARIEGTAQVWMQIDRDGVLRSQRLESSSGHRILDEAALTLVRRAAPFPRIPGIAPERIEVILPVSYRLDSGS